MLFSTKSLSSTDTKDNNIGNAVHMKKIIPIACCRVIAIRHKITKYLLSVTRQMDKIEIGSPDTIMMVEMRHLKMLTISFAETNPTEPNDHPPLANRIETMTVVTILYIRSAQHKLSMNKVSTDLFRTRKMDAMTSVSNKIPRIRRIFEVDKNKTVI